jgi:hypothetical protein
MIGRGRAGRWNSGSARPSWRVSGGPLATGWRSVPPRQRLASPAGRCGAGWRRAATRGASGAARRTRCARRTAA